MAVVMRLRRMGGNQRPFYRLVVTDSRNPREGRFLERLGDYNPMRETDNLNLKPERIEHWLKVGAIPSERVSQLLRTKGIGLVKPTAPKAEAKPKAAKEVKETKVKTAKLAAKKAKA